MISPLVALKLSISLLSIHLIGSILGVHAEKHTIRFDNQCGYGSPRLIQSGNVLSTGEPYTSTGPFWSGIAYLQTGNCFLNGEGCTVVEMSLANPTCPGCGSSADLSLIPPLAFSVPTSFSYSGGCNGKGATCSSGNCKTAFFVPNDNHVQVQCQENDVDLVITFCDSKASSPSGSGSKSPSLPAPIAHIPSVTLALDDTPSPIASVLAPPPPSTGPPNGAQNSQSSPNNNGITSKPPVCVKGRASRRKYGKRNVVVIEREYEEPQLSRSGVHEQVRRFQSGTLRRVRLGYAIGKRRLVSL